MFASSGMFRLAYSFESVPASDACCRWSVSLWHEFAHSYATHSGYLDIVVSRATHRRHSLDWNVLRRSFQQQEIYNNTRLSNPQRARRPFLQPLVLAAMC